MGPASAAPSGLPLSEQPYSFPENHFMATAFGRVDGDSLLDFVSSSSSSITLHRQTTPGQFSPEGLGGFIAEEDFGFRVAIVDLTATHYNDLAFVPHEDPPNTALGSIRSSPAEDSGRLAATPR